VEGLPKMLGFQAEGAAPIVRGRLSSVLKRLRQRSGIGNPASWKQAEAARDESGGLIDMVSDDEILEAYRMTANLEESFVSLPRQPRCRSDEAGPKGFLQERDVLVLTLTGHGLKDPDIAIRVSQKPSLCPRRRMRC